MTIICIKKLCKMITVLWLSIALSVFTSLLSVLLAYRCDILIREKDSKCYTDYRHKNLVLRVFKPEFEFEAIGNVPINKILDRGTLSKFYNWCLIEK